MRIEDRGFTQGPVYGQRAVREEINFAEEMIEFRKRIEGRENEEVAPADKEKKSESEKESCAADGAKPKAATETETETEAESARESKTDTEVVVKPDGTRVLMITVRVGETERVMSLKLSDSTDLPNSPSQTGAEEGAAATGTGDRTIGRTAANIADRTAVNTADGRR